MLPVPCALASLLLSFLDGWILQERVLPTSVEKVGLGTSFQDSKEKEIVGVWPVRFPKPSFHVLLYLYLVLPTYNIFHSQSKTVQTPCCHEKVISHRVQLGKKNLFICISVGVYHVSDMGVHISQLLTLKRERKETLVFRF